MACSLSPMSCLPHACGGVSSTMGGRYEGKESSPRLWGCFSLALMPAPLPLVFPTPVGVFLRAHAVHRSGQRLPHACGGVSLLISSVSCFGLSSPRLWGCFLVISSGFARGRVFPTPVGVFPRREWCGCMSRRLPHACGGVSWMLLYWTMSPAVFPTPVGVFPLLVWFDGLVVRLPHACGGVSAIAQVARSGRPSSPRLWGCFSQQLVPRRPAPVFPTPVGVFPKIHKRGKPHERLPHARGGVSVCECPAIDAALSSPRPWGCFWFSPRDPFRPAVFPTPVGVFLHDLMKRAMRASLPHARGGVSGDRLIAAVLQLSSPRPWGCFWIQRATSQ